MAGDEKDLSDLREGLRGFPFTSRMGADAPLESGGELGGEEGDGGEVERGKGMVKGAGCSSMGDELSSSSSSSSCAM